MSQTTIVLACPSCKKTCRTHRETRPGAEFRCPGCHRLFYFFVHGNGAVELRPVDDEPATDGPATGSRLPPRFGTPDEAQGTRKILTSRRRNRSIGGYKAFGKSRSWIAMFAFLAVVGVVSLTAYVYFDFIKSANNQMGKTVNKGFNSDIEAKGKEYRARQKKALANLEKLKQQATKAQPAGAKVEDGRLAGDQTHD
jgi:hypothetical protein